MKKIVLILFFGFLSVLSFGQNLNQIVLDDQRNMEILIGELDMKGIRGPIFGEYCHKEFNSYQPETSIIESLIQGMLQTSATLLFYTWCGDSKKEVPRMLKVLSDIGVDNDAIKLFAVDSKKEAAGTIVESLNILKVPTLIVFQSELEVGRIIETPVLTIEEDLLKIIE